MIMALQLKQVTNISIIVRTNISHGRIDLSGAIKLCPSVEEDTRDSSPPWSQRIKILKVSINLPTELILYIKSEVHIPTQNNHLLI